MVLSLALLMVAVAPANAQSFGGSMSTKKKVAIIGGGAAAGAVAGGLLGGKKGAAIGAAVGGGAGTAYVYIKGKREEDRWEEYGYRDYDDDDYYYSRRDDNRRYVNRRDGRRGSSGRCN